MNISESVDRFAREIGNSKPAMVFDDTGESWTYEEINGKVNRIANALEGLGARPGARIALMLRSRPELVFCGYGIYRMGGIHTVVNSRLKEKETRHILVNSGAEILICDASVASLIADIRPQCDGLRHIVVYGGDAPEGMMGFDEFIADRSDVHAIDPDVCEEAAIFYTGGTTGTPKGVVLTHASIIGNNLASSRRLHYDRDSIVVSANPMFHIGGMAGGPLYAFLHGGTLVLQEYFSAEKYLAAVRKYRANHIWGVPAFYYSINALPESLAPADAFKDVRMAFSAAGVFYTPVRKAFEERFGLKVYQYYGLTENSPGVTVEDPDSPDPRRWEAVGTPLPDTEIKIVDNDDKVVPPGISGELCVRGPHMMKGYWRNPEATENAMRGGWLHTGDQGYVDDKDYFHIVGRKHDMILVGGSNVYPAEVEKLIMEDEPRLKEIAVVGIRDDRLGEIPKAFCVVRAGQSITEREIIEVARAKMAHYKAPRSVEFIDALPLTTVGKVDKRALQARE